MNTPTPEQLDIINHPLERICVSAGAGSGKTETIVRRVIELQKKIPKKGARIAVLSFTNVAVSTFKKAHRELSVAQEPGILIAPVEFATLDSFLFRNILKPHGHLSMGANRAPFLVHGTEPFLESMKFNHPLPRNRFVPKNITDLKIAYDGSDHLFFYYYQNDLYQLNEATGLRMVNSLASHGGHTVESGRYWALRTLIDQEFVRRAFVKRFPEIIVDEAQDIGLIHDEVLNCLNAYGSRVSLFGDSNQSIYEFNNADGSYLKDYNNGTGVTVKELQMNWRSVPSIVEKANNLSGRADVSGRSEPNHLSGAFFITYNRANEASFVDRVLTTLPQEISVDDFAVLCRSHSIRIKTSGQGADNVGKGCTKGFAEAALKRDEVLAAGFQEFVATFARLIDRGPADFLDSVLKSGSDDTFYHIRQMLWAFYRDTEKGLPSTGMKGQSEWQPALIANLRVLLPRICDAIGGSVSTTLGQKVSRKGLTDEPVRVSQAPTPEKHQARIDTVHGAKGESIGGVVYIATKPQAQAMLNGCDTEDGRIGYVALTRAKDLFVLAIPEASLSDLQADLDRHGFLPLPENEGTKNVD